MMRLPSHPDSTISDPLSILDSDEALVPYWDFLSVLLRPLLQAEAGNQGALLVSKFIDTLETICYSLSGNGSPDFSLLSEVAAAQLSRLIGPIIKTVLSMRELFPDGALSIFEKSPGIPSLEPPPTVLNCPLASECASQENGRPGTVALTHAQISCLICHMFIGTFSKPSWMFWDGPNLGPAWFANDGKGDSNIKKAYIHVLLAYLEETLLPGPILLVAPAGPDAAIVNYSLFDYDDKHGAESSEMPCSLSDLLTCGGTGFSSKHLIPLRIFLLEEEDDDYEACFMSTDMETREIFCQLVSANKEIGFGPAATQEERMFGSIPALLPSVLMTPPLSATQGLLISGDTKLYGHYTGHLRSAQLRKIYPSSERNIQNRRGRSFLFLDALEMDGDQHGNDLDVNNMYREMRKLMGGFSALVNINTLPSQDEPRQQGEPRTIVVLPPWGCGTFGGDFKVKLPLIWMAASLCGISELRFAAKQGRWKALGLEWRMLIETMGGNGSRSKIWSVTQVCELLTHLEKRKRENQSIDWPEQSL